MVTEGKIHVLFVFQELWALFDFVHQGSLLGTSRTFKMEYENPITKVNLIFIINLLLYT